MHSRTPLPELRWFFIDASGAKECNHCIRIHKVARVRGNLHRAVLRLINNNLLVFHACLLEVDDWAHDPSYTPVPLVPTGRTLTLHVVDAQPAAGWRSKVRLRDPGMVIAVSRAQERLPCFAGPHRGGSPRIAPHTSASNIALAVIAVGVKWCMLGP